jgi:hypothetical protein
LHVILYFGREKGDQELLRVPGCEFRVEKGRNEDKGKRLEKRGSVSRPLPSVTRAHRGHRGKLAEVSSFWPDSTEKACNQARPDTFGVVFKAITRGTYRFFAGHYAAEYRV